MLFYSPEFFIFFAIYLGLHFAAPAGIRLYLIIVGGMLFYGFWNPLYAWIPVTLTLTGYIGGILISPGSKLDPGWIKIRLALSIVVLTAPLII